jgi:Tol biopolymer transport system component
VAGHLTQAPEPVGRVRRGLPPALEQLVMRCLEKDPGDRWQRSDEMLAVLEGMSTPGDGTVAPAPGRGASRKRGRVLRGLAAVAALAALALAAWWMSRPAAPRLTMGRASQLTTDPGLEISPAISPDGRLVAYAGGTSARMRIYLRPVGGGRTLALSDDTATVESQPAWSPDGERVLFLSRGGVYVASSLGGGVREVVPPNPAARVVTAAWAPDGSAIAAVRADSVVLYAPDGTRQRHVAHSSELNSCAWSPMATWLACVSGNPRYLDPGVFFANTGPSRIVLIAMDDGRTVTVTDSASFNQHPRWSGDASRLYFVSNREGTRDIYALSIRPDGRPRGEPVRLTTGLNVHSFSLDRDERRLSYAVYQERANLWSLPIPDQPPVSLSGATQLTSGTQVIEVMRASGGWVLYDSDQGGNADIYRIPTGGGTPERLTRDAAHEYSGTLSPDGTEFAFHSFRAGSRDIYVQPVDGGAPRQLTRTPAQECCAQWGPDGRALTFALFAREGGIAVVRRDSAGRWGEPQARLPRGFLHRWSPDGRTLAVATGGTIRGSLQSERLELVPMDSGEATVVYAVRDTLNDPVVGDPTWSPDGQGIYIKSHDVAGRASFWYVPLSTGRPQLLVRFDDPDRPSFRGNFAADRERFYFAINDRQSDIWVAEVRR